MNRDRPIVTLNRVAGFSNDGYLFDWRVDPAFTDPSPRKFTVYEADTPSGPWRTVSPRLTEVYVWKEGSKRILNRDDTKYFKVVMETQSGKYTSPALPDKRPGNQHQELLLTEILRRENLIAKVKNGVKGQIYLRNRYGGNCLVCNDDVLGTTLEGSFCDVCGGFNKVPPMYGPYPAWFTMSNTARVTEQGPEGIGKATFGTYKFRLATPVQVKSSDVLRVCDTAKLYYVGKVEVVAEISGAPAIQEAEVNEVPTTDKLYNIRMFETNG